MGDHDVFRRDLIGKWGDEHEFVVEAERTVAYAEATNDPGAGPRAVRARPWFWPRSRQPWVS